MLKNMSFAPSGSEVLDNVSSSCVTTVFSTSESFNPAIGLLTTTSSITQIMMAATDSNLSKTQSIDVTHSYSGPLCHPPPVSHQHQSVTSAETLLDREPQTPLKYTFHDTLNPQCRMKYTPVDSATNISPLSANQKPSEDFVQLESQDNKSAYTQLSSNQVCIVAPGQITGSTEVNSQPQQEDEPGDLADVEDEEELDFIWEDYLKETGASPVPPTAFRHVELSLQSGFAKGMKLEAPNKHDCSTYWVATIVMTCGPLLRLRYEGYDDNSSADFWSDPMTSDIHPLGWSEENGKTLQPPEVIEEKHPEWKEFLAQRLLNSLKAPEYLLDKSRGATPVDQLCEGMKLEVQDVIRRDRVWVAHILENVGGRLLLRYEGNGKSAHDFWLFYLDERLHPVGWGQQMEYGYHIPEGLHMATPEEELIESFKTSLCDNTKLVPADIFKDQTKVIRHNFEVGMRLEAVDPTDRHSICPATVIEVLDPLYFIVEIECLQTSSDDSKTHVAKFGCHSGTSTIFPVKWAEKHGIKLRTPRDWTKREFDWDEYLQSVSAKSAPEELFHLDCADHQLECGMKLEAVNPAQTSQIAVATITQCVANLVWVHLDSSPQPLDSHVTSVSSLDLLPIGWCVSNGYQLQPPASQLLRRSCTVANDARILKECALDRRPLSTSGHPRPRSIAIVKPEIAENQNSGVSRQSKNRNDVYSGPQVFINHRCFSGPYLSKGRIAELQRSVGPGPVSLVMKEVLRMLINAAYKSSRVLKELQLEGKPNPRMIQHTLKAKYKGKSYRAVVEICRVVGQLESFCRDVCVKLECCPNLISPCLISGDCPEKCDQLTKTRYNIHHGRKKRKLSRPLNGEANEQEGQEKASAMGRKRKKIGLLANQSCGVDQDEDDKESGDSDSRTVDSKDNEADNVPQKPIKKPQLSPKSLAEKRHKLARERMALKRRYQHHIPPPSGIRTRGAKLPKYSFEKRTHKKIMIVDSSSHPSKSKKEHLTKALLNLPNKKRENLKSTASWVSLSSSSSSSSMSSLPARPGHFLGHRGRPIGFTNAFNIVPGPVMVLDSNPLGWTVTQVATFLLNTDCQDLDLIAKLKAEEIDGQALLLLTLPNVQEYLGIKLGPAIKLCRVIERLKVAFFHQFAK